MSGTRLKQGDVFENFTYNSPFQSGKDFYEATGGKPSFVIFLRYYGCTICQLDMKLLVEKYKEFQAKGAEVFVVLQSDPAVVREGVKEGDFPYDIICDTDMGLYKKYDLGVAKDAKELVVMDETLEKKRKMMEDMGLEHGKYEGEELQLPAVFLVDTDKKVKVAHYASHLTDMPSFDEMIAML